VTIVALFALAVIVLLGGLLRHIMSSGADLSHGLVMEVPRIEGQSSQRSAACSILQIQPAI
jgi:predicted ABC-type sugar transport system permease subunit